MARYVPITDKETGAVRMVERSHRLPLRGEPKEMGFHETILEAYRQVEADGKYQGPYPKGYVKRVHETAMARDARTGGR